MPDSGDEQYRYVDLWHCHGEDDCEALEIDEISEEIGPPHSHDRAG